MMEHVTEVIKTEIPCLTEYNYIQGNLGNTFHGIAESICHVKVKCGH
jgi:hypothetical protein